MNHRRQALRTLMGAACALSLPAALGQAFPDRTIHLVVAYPPGGQADAIGRLTARKLGAMLGGTVIVENRPGGNSTVAADFVARAPADGYTLLLGAASNLTVAPVFESQIRYDPLRDFVPVGRIARVPQLLVVRASLPISTMAQLLEYARRHPGKLTFASTAAANELAIESLKASERLDIVVVPYKGMAPGMLDLVGERVDLAISDVTTVTPHVRSGALRVIANASATRAREFRDVPTMTEQGVPSYVFESWQSLVAPKATPPEVVARLQSALRQALAAPDFREALERMGFVPIDEAVDAFPAALRTEIERHKALAQKLGRAPS